MSKLQSLGKTAKKVALTAGVLLLAAGTWVGYNQYIAKPEVYIEYKIDKHQKETVLIESKYMYTTQYGHKKVILGMGGLWEREQGPGWNFRFPFETAYDIDVSKVIKLERGYRSGIIGVETEYEEKSYINEAIMVTGDEGELEVQYAVHFIKKDPNQFLFNVKNPIHTVSEVTESALREIIGIGTYDNALTVDRKKIQDEATKLAQKVLDDYETGVELIGILLQPIKPPTPDVQDAFNDIHRAIQDAERYIQDGQKVYEKETREAAGEKEKVISNARGIASEKINRALGKVARFNELYEGYKHAPEANKFRIREETKRNLLEKSQVKIIDPKASGSLLQHLMLDDKQKEGTK